MSTPEKKYDVFISYASDNRDEIAYPIARELKKNGYNVWFDEISLSLGDSLRQGIDQAMTTSRYAIVILSKAFFSKGWTNYELNGLVELNIEEPGILIPIWFDVTKAEVAKYSPSLSNIVAIRAQNLSIQEISNKLTSKLGEYHYHVNDNEELVRSPDKINIVKSDRDSGVQVIKSINTDYLINETTCICTNEAIIYPYGDVKEYHFNYWQGLKGELSVITHMAYDYNTGNLISTDYHVEINDGNRLLSIVHFNKISEGPIKIVCKISATNLHSRLFTEGFSDMGFNHGAELEYFAYYFTMPDKEHFRSIKAFTDNEELVFRKVAGRLEVEHVIRNVKANTVTNYNFLNTND